MCDAGVRLHPELAATVVRLRDEADLIADERRAELERLAGFIRSRGVAGVPARLVFICTHNSRRSQMAQVWADAAARIYGLQAVRAFSGGTEATAFEPRAVAALERAGFVAERLDGSGNPVYRIHQAANGGAIHCFSKAFDQPPNPTAGFAAVMTCSTAAEACPIVPGADERFALSYEDPKASDGGDRERATYDDCCRRIGREMLYALSLVHR